MKTTEELFKEHLRYITKDTKKWLTLFRDDAVMEFPYAPSIQLKEKFPGVAAIAAHMDSLPKGFGDIEFTNIVTHLMTDPNMLVAEFDGHIPADGKTPPYNQKYFVVMTAHKGKIIHYREYWNPIEVLSFFKGE